MAKKGKSGGKGKALKSAYGMYESEEERRKAIELAQKEAKERQAIEEKNSKLNRIKIQTQWREIMKQAKAQELKRQVDILQQVHERHADRKSAAMKTLEQDLQESEEQYETALQSHLINVDTLIDLQMQRLSSLQKMFEADKNILENEFNTERTKIQAQHIKEKSDIMRMVSRMEHEFQEAEADARHEFSSLRDDIKNKNLEEKHALRIQLEGNVEDLWRQFQQALTQYNSATEERKKQFEDLKQKDQKNAKEIEIQMKKLVKLQESISQLKMKMATNSKESEERNKALKEDKEAIQSQFQELKRQMTLFRESEKMKLTDLTTISSKAIKSLKSRVEMAEKILKLAEMNRKLETEEEKVIPFYEDYQEKTGPAADPTLKAIAEETQKALEAAQSSEDNSIELPKEFEALERFHKRYNKVLLDKLALDSKKAALQEENNHLRLILKQYLDGISVNEEVLASRNPLLVVNGKTNVPLRAHAEPVRVVCVEANNVYSF